MTRRVGKAKKTVGDIVAERLQTGSSNGSGGTENRITRLEVEFEYVRKDLGEIKSDIEDIGKKLASVPTSNKLFGYTATVAALAVAIIGVLSYVGKLG